MLVHLIVSQQPEKAYVFLKVSNKLKGVPYRDNLRLQIIMFFHK